MNRFHSGWTIAVVLMLALVLAPVWLCAELCPKCADLSFIATIGKCGNCGASTTSGAFKLCPACSTTLKQCQACRVALSSFQPIVPPFAAPVPVVQTNAPPAAVAPVGSPGN